MAVGKQSSADVTVTYDDSAGGTPRIITGFVMELGAAEIEVETQTSDAFGLAWRAHSPTGMRKSPPINVKGEFDTTATTGPHVTLRPGDGDAAPNALTRTLVIVFGDGKTFTVETRLVKYRVVPNAGKLTDFEATIQPTGAAVWTP